MDLDVTIFAYADLDWNLLFSLEFLQTVWFSFGTAGHCRTAG